MSNDALTWAFNSDLPPGQRFVLVALADQGQDHSGEDWTCFPSIAKLIRRTGNSRPTVERHLRWLTEDGWIQRTRRRRPDGTLGIYDFVLIRERPGLGPAGCVIAAAKARKASPDQRLESETEGEPPYVNLTCGEGAQPDVNMIGTTRQIDAQPYVNLMGQEPLGEPLVKPTTGAREPGDDGFEAGFAAYEARGQARTDQPAARAAWALARESLGQAELVACVAAAVPQLGQGDYGAPAFEKWLAREAWRVLLPAVREAAAPAAAGPMWPGPAEIRAAFGEVEARSYLDRSGWDEATRTITPWSAAARRWMADGPVAGVLRRLGASVAELQARAG